MTKQQSMTAFARAVTESPQQRISVEIRSLNHRFLEMSFKLPDDFRHLESPLREKLQAVLKRGKVDVWIYQEIFRTEPQKCLDPAAVEHWLAVFAPFSTNPDLAKLSWSEILPLPGVLVKEKEPEEESDQKVITLFEQALEQFLEMRYREGAGIISVLESRLAAIENQVNALLRHLPVTQEKFRMQLRERLAVLQTEVDNGRFEQELVYLLSKIDVKEELDRLLFHVAEARKTLQENGGIGRRLDFLMQEFNREANTLGAKAGDQVLSRAAVDLKVLIEQMREQVQNLA